MRIVQMRVYKFVELSKKSQDRVIARFRDSNDESILESNMRERLDELLKENNIESIDDDRLEVYYSLSYAQGDGAMFTGRFKWGCYYVTVTHIGNYSHCNAKNIEMVSDAGYDEHDEVVFNDIYVSIAKQLEGFGYDEIEYQNSEDVIKETIDANGYEFYDDGSIYVG
ncbi:MAG: hypothetical protein EPN25_15415 [Nitrospirae bacterium]|nr:MAG: hypothetical protein EPN25_15415 [Nitrospirota bacterium]